MKRKQCNFIKDDLAKCTSFAMNRSDFCYRHNPDISEEDKINASSLGGKANSQPEFIETPFPEMKIENYQDVVSILADTINNVRSGKISQKSGSTIGYLSFIMLLAMDKAKKEAKDEKIEKLKAEGKWRPDPVYGVKVYTYKDDFYLDKDGNRLIVEKNNSNYFPEDLHEPEEDEDKSQTENIKKPKTRKRRHRSVSSVPKNGISLPPVKLIREVLSKEEHEKPMDNPISRNFSGET